MIFSNQKICKIYKIDVQIFERERKKSIYQTLAVAEDIYTKFMICFYKKNDLKLTMVLKSNDGNGRVVANSHVLHHVRAHVHVRDYVQNHVRAQTMVLSGVRVLVLAHAFQ